MIGPNLGQVLGQGARERSILALVPTPSDPFSRNRPKHNLG
jgi:hypothetical protein